MEMLGVRLLMLVTLVGAGAAVIWAARAAATGRLRRNQFAGIRTPSTLASDEAWLAAHRVARVPTEVAGWGSVVAGIAYFAVGDTLLGSLTSTVFGLVVLLGGVLVGAARGVKAARAVPLP